MADERVVIRIDVNADTTGIDRVRRKLRELAAEAEVLDRRMNRVNDRFEANADATDRLTASHTRASTALKDHDRNQDRFGNRLNKTARRLTTAQRATGIFAKVLGTTLKIALIGATIEMVALGAAVATVNGLFSIGQGAVKLYRFAMAGVAYAAAAVTAAVATAAAAQREYNAAMVAYRYKSTPALGSGTAQAMSALRMLTSDQQLATFGMQNLNAAFAAVSKNAEFSPAMNRALRGVADFAVVSGDMGKGLTAVGNFIGLLQKSGTLTEDVLKAAAEVGPEFQKSVEEAQKRGLTSADQLMRAMASGDLSRAAGVDGALAGVNDTLIGQLKAFMTEMTGRFADLGQTFLPGVKKALYELSSIFRVTFNRISADLGQFGSGKLLDDIVKVTAKMADFFVTLFEKYLPQSDGMMSKLGGAFKTVGNIFMEVRNFLEPMREGAKVITDTFGPVILNILKGFGDSMGTIASLAVENKDEFMDFGNSLSNVFNTVQRFFNDFKKAFVASMPLLTNLFNTLSTAVNGLLTVFEKLFGLVGNGPQAGLLAVLLGGGAMVGMSRLKDFGLGKGRQRGGLGDWMSGASDRVMRGNVISNNGGIASLGTMTVRATTVNVYGAMGAGGNLGPVDDFSHLPPPPTDPRNPSDPNQTRRQRLGNRIRTGFSRGKNGFFNMGPGGVATTAALAAVGGGSLTGELLPNPLTSEDPLSGAARGLQTGIMLGAPFGPKGIAIAALASTVAGLVSGYVNQNNYAPGMDVFGDQRLVSMAAGTMNPGLLVIGQVAAYLDDRSERDQARDSAGAMAQAQGLGFGTTLVGEGVTAAQRSLTTINDTVNEIVRLGETFNGVGWEDRIAEASRLLEQGAITQEMYAALADEHHGTYIDALKEERDIINEFSTNAIGEYQRKIDALRTSTGLSGEEITKLASSMGVDLSDASITLADAVQKLGLSMEMTTEQLQASIRKVSFQVIENVFGRELKKYETNSVINQAAEALRGGGGTREDRVRFLETLATQANNLFPDDPFAAMEFVRNQVGVGGKQFTDPAGPLAGQEAQFADVQPLIDEYMADTRTKATAAFASTFGANMEARGIRIDRDQLITTMSQMPLEALMPLMTELNNLSTKLKTEGLSGEDAQSTVTAVMDQLGLREVGLTITNAQDQIAQNVQNSLSEGARELRETLRGAIEQTPNWWSTEPPWWNTTPGGGSLTAPGGIGGADGDPTTPNDTRTPRAFGDSLTSRLGRTMSRHGFFDSQLSGRRNVTSAWRNWGLGSMNSDHVTGNAYDLTGDNLGAYAGMVNRMGGFAEFHGAGGSRHLHVVPGQTPIGDAMSPVGVASAPVAVGGSTYNVTVNALPGQDVNAIAAAVMAQIEAKERSNRERA